MPYGASEMGFGEHGKISCLRTASITHGSELSFMEFLDLFKSFRFDSTPLFKVTSGFFLDRDAVACLKYTVTKKPRVGPLSTKKCSVFSQILLLALS